MKRAAQRLVWRDAIGMVAAMTMLSGACRHGGGAASAPSITDPPISSPPTLFAALFSGDREMHYTVYLHESRWDSNDPAADEHGEISTHRDVALSCRLRVGVVGHTRTALLTCEDATEYVEILSSIEGLYVTDGTALWKGAVAEPPFTERDLAALTREPHLIVAEPVPISEITDEADGAGTETHSVDAEGAGWCVHDSYASDGNTGGHVLCIDGSRGVYRVSQFYDGATSLEQTAELDDGASPGTR